MKRSIVLLFTALLLLLSAATAFAEEAPFCIRLSTEQADIYVRESLKLKPAVVSNTDKKAPAVSFVWTSSDPAVATVNGGNVTGKGPGEAVITCAAKNDGSVFAECIVRVLMPAAKVTLSESNITLLLHATKEGCDTARLTAAVSPEDAAYPGVVWSSSDPGVVTVDETGVLKAVSVGTAKVTAALNEPGRKSSPKAVCTVTVAEAVQAIKVRGVYLGVRVGAHTSADLVITPDNAGSKKLIWSSSDESIATVNASGSITGVSAGTCSIICTAADGGGASRSIKVVVIQPLTRLLAKENTRLVREGDYLEDNVLFFPENATNKSLDWASSDNTVLSISRNGITMCRPGVCTVTGTAEDGSNKKVSFRVIVPPTEGTLYIANKSFLSGKETNDPDKYKSFIKVANIPDAKTVTAFDVRIVISNQAGKVSRDFTMTTKRRLAGGKSTTTGFFEYSSKVSEIDAYITRIEYEDGTVVTSDGYSTDYAYWGGFQTY